MQARSSLIGGASLLWSASCTRCLRVWLARITTGPPWDITDIPNTLRTRPIAIHSDPLPVSYAVPCFALRDAVIFVARQGKALERPESHTPKLWMVHKMRNELVTRHDPEGRATVFDRLAKLKLPDTLMPVVRNTTCLRTRTCVFFVVPLFLVLFLVPACRRLPAVRASEQADVPRGREGMLLLQFLFWCLSFLGGGWKALGNVVSVDSCREKRCGLSLPPPRPSPLSMTRACRCHPGCGCWARTHTTQLPGLWRSP